MTRAARGTEAASLVLLALAAVPGRPAAQAPPGTPPAAATSAPPASGSLPLAAMRHQQPTEESVIEREDARDGADRVREQQRREQQRREQEEVDRLYKQLVGKSPQPGGGPEK